MKSKTYYKAIGSICCDDLKVEKIEFIVLATSVKEAQQLASEHFDDNVKLDRYSIMLIVNMETNNRYRINAASYNIIDETTMLFI